MSRRKHGWYCKVCGEWKANEKFSRKGHAAHICKDCMPWKLRRQNKAWLGEMKNDPRQEVRNAADFAWDMRFSPDLPEHEEPEWDDTDDIALPFD